MIKLESPAFTLILSLLCMKHGQLLSCSREEERKLKFYLLA